MEQKSGYRNILIIKPSALGDIVHALPVLTALRESFPQARISWLVRKEFAPLLDCVSGLDEVIIFDRKQFGKWWYSWPVFLNFMTFLRGLRSRSFDLVLDLQGLFRTAFFAWQTGCPLRVGLSTAREGASVFYTKKITPPKQSLHLIDYYRKIMQDIGADTMKPGIGFTLPASVAESLQTKLSAMSIGDEPYAILIPGSAVASKCWPAEQFSEIAEKLVREYGLRIVIVGSMSERPLAEQVISGADVEIVNLAGLTNLAELVGVIQNASLVISNDTGPGHIAVAQHVPTVMIFGHTNPMRVGPYGRIDTIAAIEPMLRGMSIENSSSRFHIRNVTSSMVWEKVQMVLSHRKQQP